MVRTGVDWRPLLVTSLTIPSFSVTRTRPSGRKANAVGKLRLLAMTSSRKLSGTCAAACATKAPPPLALAVGSGPPQTQPASSWRAFASAAASAEASGPRPVARARPAATRAVATERPSGVLTRYIRRFRSSSLLAGSSSRATPRLTSDCSSARAALPHGVPSAGASMPSTPMPVRRASISTSKVSPSMTRTKPDGLNGPLFGSGAPPGATI